MWSHRGICALREFYQHTRFRQGVQYSLRTGEAKQRKTSVPSAPPRPAPVCACAAPRLTTRGRPAPGFLPGARAQRCPCLLRVPASLPATVIDSFRPGRASAGLKILEAESPILRTGKKLRKSWRTVLKAGGMGGRRPRDRERDGAVESGAAAAERPGGGTGVRALDGARAGGGQPSGGRRGLWPPPRNQSYPSPGPGGLRPRACSLPGGACTQKAPASVPRCASVQSSQAEDQCSDRDEKYVKRQRPKETVPSL